MDFAKTQRCYKGNSDEPSHILVAPTVNWWRASRAHAHRERGRFGANWLSRRDLEHRDGQVPAYSVEKLEQVPQHRSNGSRELDSKEISARNWISCNLRESNFAFAARSIRAVEFFNRIGQNRKLEFRISMPETGRSAIPMGHLVTRVDFAGAILDSSIRCVILRANGLGGSGDHDPTGVTDHSIVCRRSRHDTTHHEC